MKLKLLFMLLFLININNPSFSQEKTIYFELKGALKNPEQVVELHLRYKKIKVFPKEIFKMKNLRVLVLRSLYIKEIPSEIKKLQKLEKLVIRDCLVKTLPKELSLLSNLRILYLSSSHLESKLIFPIIIKLGNLEELQFVTTMTKLPSNIKYFKKLKILDLSFSDRLQYLAPEIGTLKNLQILNVSFSRLKELPKEIGRLRNLEKLFLGGSHMSFNLIKMLPDEIKHLGKLKILTLYNTPLSRSKIERERTKKLLPNCDIFFFEHEGYLNFNIDKK